MSITTAVFILRGWLLFVAMTFVPFFVAMSVSFTMAALVLAAFLVAVALMPFFVAMSVSFTVAVALMPFFVVSVAAASLAVVAASLFWKELSVQSFCKLLLCGVTYGYDLALEIQGLAGHRMVEVHSDGICVHGCDKSLDYHT